MMTREQALERVAELECAVSNYKYATTMRDEKIEELESLVASLKQVIVMKDILIEEARVLADAERRAADAMEARMAVVIGGHLVWAAQA